MSRAVDAWSHAEVCLWLRTSGFIDLTDIFTKHNIVGHDLRSLDDNALAKKLGVSDGKMRHSVLAAIDNLLEKSGTRRVAHSTSSANLAVAGSDRPGQPNLPARGMVQRGMTVPTSLGSASTASDEQNSNQRTVSYPSGAHSTGKRLSAPHVNTKGMKGSTLQAGTMLPGGQPSLGVSAQQLMADGHMDCCGWIRKQGGSVRSWKRRYLILKSGCMYYYKDDTASHAQGQFSLEGYRVAQATDTKFPWCIKLMHVDTKRRIYFISVSSEPEMRQWMEKVACATRDWNSEVASATSPSSPSATSTAAPPPIRPRPASTLPGHARQAPGPSNSLRSANSGFVEHDLDDEDDSDDDSESTHSPSGHGHKKPSKLSPSPEVAPRHLSPPAEEAQEPNDYLQLEEGSIGPPPVHLPVHSPAHQNGGRPTSSDATAKPHGQRYEITDLRKVSTKKPPHKDVATVDEECDYIYPEVDALNFLPASVFQDGMDRDTAEGILKAQNRTGKYLIRSGSGQPSQKVLSVWTDDRCRHYKVFFDEKLKYSLQRGMHFATLPTLVQHYHANALPKCEFKLVMPYTG